MDRDQDRLSETSSETPPEVEIVSRQGRHTPGDKKNYSSMSSDMPLFYPKDIDVDKNRFPHSVVWTPIPLITWLFPFIGHMGICTTQGVIRDFAGPYFVSEDCMGFGNPTKYWQLDPSMVTMGNNKDIWDRAVFDASEEYKGRMHNLCCDNCHSHVAFALNLMKYNGSTSWNMVKLCFLMLVHGKYVSFAAMLKTWLPFIILAIIIVVVVVLTQLL
jgi:archaellum component FlaF (FlaF/FlaG flagellin family)